MAGPLLLPQSLVFFLCLLALLSGVCLGGWATWTAAKRKEIDASFRDILRLTAELIRFTAARMAANITSAIVISFLLFGVLCWSHGYYFRGALDNRVRYTYTDVLIVARHNDHKFTIQPARMREWDTDDLCDPEDWQPHQKLISMTFSVRRDANGKACKDVEAGGEWYRYMKDGKPIIYPEELADVR